MRHLLCLALVVTPMSLAIEPLPSQVRSLPTWVQHIGGPSPSPRVAHAAVYDEARGQIVLFGGVNGPVPPSNVLGDTWLWTGAGWTQAIPNSSPPARAHHAMAYDRARQRVVLFGGWNGLSPLNAALNDTWEWDGTTWTQVQSPTRPPPRMKHALAFDSVGGRVLLFGGDDGRAHFSDTWEWTGGAWVPLSPPSSPSARSAISLTGDPRRRQIVLFGGVQGTTYLDDTWIWDGSSWSQHLPGFRPPRRGSASMTFDVGSGRVILVGGSANGTVYSDAWAWSGSSWQSLGSVPAQSRFWSSVAYDPAGGDLVMFGGQRTESPGWGTYDGETWVASHTASFSIFGQGCPERGGVVPMLDASLGSLPVLGGTFVARISNLPNIATVVIPFYGFSQIVPTMSLAPFGMPGCNLLVMPYRTEFRLVLQGWLDWQIPLPCAPFLAGQDAYLQAFVVDPVAPNTLGATMTNGGTATLGW